MSTSNAVPQGRVNTVQDRITALTNRREQPMVCTSCGSTHFYIVRTDEFADGGYGTAQLRSLTLNQEALYVCICGAPVPLKDTSTGKGAESARARFLKSLQLALQYQKSSSSQTLAQGMVSIAEYQEVKDQLVEMNEKLEWVMEAVEHLSKSEVEEETEDEAEVETETNAQTQGQSETPAASGDTSEKPAPRRGRGPGKNKADATV